MRHWLLAWLCVSPVVCGGCRSADRIFDPIEFAYDAVVDTAFETAFPENSEYDRQAREVREFDDRIESGD